MNIKITADGLSITGTLNNTQTSQDFMKKLPLKITLNKHQNREYYGSVKLSKNTPIQNGYKVGDFAYWAGGDSLVLFYDKGYTDNLIIMGTITSGLEQLANMEYTFEALIEVAK